MKRIVSAFVIAVIIALLTIAGNIAVSELASRYALQLNNVEYCAKTKNELLAVKEIKSLVRGFNEKKHILEMFIKRDYIANLSVSLEGLQAYANADTWRDLESEAAKAREQLYAIQHLYFRII